MISRKSISLRKQSINILIASISIYFHDRHDSLLPKFLISIHLICDTDNNINILETNTYQNPLISETHLSLENFQKYIMCSVASQQQTANNLMYRHSFIPK